MATLAKTGHGATIAYEQDPSGAQGTFTVVAELGDDLSWGMERGVSEATAHNHTIDYHVADGRIMRPEISTTLNFVFDNATHEASSTGLQWLLQQGTETGFRLRGPSGATDTDEWICSGFVTGFTQTNPVREGFRSADLTIQLSGPMIVDGTTIGADAF